MPNFITPLHVSRPRHCVHKRVSGSGGRPRRLPPACWPPGQEGEFFGITAAAGSSLTSSSPPRRARGPGRERDEGQRGEVVAERWVQRSAGGTSDDARVKTPPPPSQQRGRCAVERWHMQGVACGLEHRQRLAQKKARCLRKSSATLARSSVKRGRGRCCRLSQGSGGATRRLRRGCLQAAWGPAAGRGGGRWVAARGRLCRNRGRLQEAAWGLGDACLCLQLAGAAAPPARLRAPRPGTPREMPGEQQRARDGILGFSQSCGPRGVFNSSTSKQLTESRGDLLLPSQYFLFWVV